MLNPPWADKIINSVRDRLAARAQQNGLPLPRCGKREKTEPDYLAECASYQAYGQAHYGAVFPTEKPGIVFKVTTDRTEAAFVALAAELERRSRYPQGIVQYFKIYAVPGVTRGGKVYGKTWERPVYMLWREEAYSVGSWSDAAGEGLLKRLGIPLDADERRKYQFTESQVQQWDEMHQGVSRFHLRLRRYNVHAHAAKRIADRHYKSHPGDYFAWVSGQIKQMDRMFGIYERWSEDNYKNQRVGVGAQPSGPSYVLSSHNAFAWYVMLCEQIATEITNENYGNFVGEALMDLINQGLLLADVHQGNLGIRQETPGHAIITDPGHLVILDEKWAKFEIEAL